MVKVIFEKECGCVKKSAYLQTQSFDCKTEALSEAKNMCEDMNTNFCLKHKFYYEDNDENITIKMEMNK